MTSQTDFDPDACAPLPTDDRARDEGYFYDPGQARIARNFIETFCLQSRPPFRRKPIRLLRWQAQEVVNRAFGWVHGDDGHRRFDNWSVWIPKKNGKSSLLSAVSVLLTVEAPAAETYLIASDIPQASIVYKEAAWMATCHPALAERFWDRSNIRELHDRENGSLLKVLSGSKEGKDGYNGSILLDEFASFKPDAAAVIWEKIEYATASRPNGVIATISTAQSNRNHVAYEQFRRARGVIEGADPADHRLLPVVYALSEEDGDDWHDPEVWRKVNPSVGVTFPLRSLEQAHEKAAKSPRSEHSFRCLRCNQWAGSADRWFGSASWDACRTDTDPEELRSQCEAGTARAVVGIDWGRSFDLAALVVLVDDGDAVHLVDPRFFLPAGILEKRCQDDGIDYRPHVRSGQVVATEGDVVNCEEFRAAVAESAGRWHTRFVAYDQSGYEGERQKLEAEHGLDCRSVSAAWNVIGPAGNKLEELILSRKFRHPGHPVMDYCVNNCVPETSKNKDLVRPGQATEAQKIDGVSATVHALALLFDDDDEPEPFAFGLDD